MPEKKKPNEVLVSAFVDINDFFKEISDEMFLEAAKERNLAFPASGFSSRSMLEALKTRLEDNADPLSEIDIITQLDLDLEEKKDDEVSSNSPFLNSRFDSLQHQQLYEEFEEARKNIHPSKLIQIFSKLNRPAINKELVLIQ